MQAAVIGAGPGGLAAARVLDEAGWRVTLFEKARGPGGRTTSKRTPFGPVDLGAQYFTARDPAFRESVARWCEAGVVARWTPRVAVIEETVSESADDTKRYVPTPRMSALARALATGLDVATGVRVRRMDRRGGGWALADDAERPLGRFDRVIVNAPADQAAPLLAPALPELAAIAADAGLAPCWALALHLDRPVADFDAAFVRNGGPIAWMARNASKPGREDHGEVWSLHATEAWSREYLEAAPDAVADALEQAFATLPGVDTAASTGRHAHRWRYAKATAPLGRGYLLDAAAGVGCCGDWTADGRVEGAWLAGRALARAMLEAGGEGG